MRSNYSLAAFADVSTPEIAQDSADLSWSVRTLVTRVAYQVLLFPVLKIAKPPAITPCMPVSTDNWGILAAALCSIS
jgi:hypothetical protein